MRRPRVSIAARSAHWRRVAYRRDDAVGERRVVTRRERLVGPRASAWRLLDTSWHTECPFASVLRRGRRVDSSRRLTSLITYARTCVRTLVAYACADVVARSASWRRRGRRRRSVNAIFSVDTGYTGCHHVRNISAAMLHRLGVVSAQHVVCYWRPVRSVATALACCTGRRRSLSAGRVPRQRLSCMHGLPLLRAQRTQVVAGRAHVLRGR